MALALNLHFVAEIQEVASSLPIILAVESGVTLSSNETASRQEWRCLIEHILNTESRSQTVVKLIRYRRVVVHESLSIEHESDFTLCRFARKYSSEVVAIA